MRTVYILLILLGLFACENKKQLTDSQIRFNNALKEQSEILDKANDYLDHNLTGSISDDIRHLIYAKELLLHAAEVLKKAKITGIQTPGFDELVKRLNMHDKVAQKHAVYLLKSAFNKTLDFKKTILEMPLAPLSGVALESGSMIEYMGAEYNDDLDTCCLVALKDIEILLRGVNDETAWEIKKKILNVETQLSKVLSDMNYQKEYSKQIANLEIKLKH